MATYGYQPNTKQLDLVNNTQAVSDILGAIRGVQQKRYESQLYKSMLEDIDKPIDENKKSEYLKLTPEERIGDKGMSILYDLTKPQIPAQMKERLEKSPGLVGRIVNAVNPKGRYGGPVTELEKSIMSGEQPGNRTEKMSKMAEYLQTMSKTMGIEPKKRQAIYSGGKFIPVPDEYDSAKVAAGPNVYTDEEMLDDNSKYRRDLMAERARYQKELIMKTEAGEDTTGLDKLLNSLNNRITETFKQDKAIREKLSMSQNQTGQKKTSDIGVNSSEPQNNYSVSGSGSKTVKTPDVSTRLPEGLTQDTLDYYLQNTNLDQDEIIRRYSEKMAGKRK